MKVVFTVGSLKLYQHYFINLINPFPVHNIPQTFTAHMSDVTNVHHYIDKTKNICFVVKMLHCLR